MKAEVLRLVDALPEETDLPEIVAAIRALEKPRRSDGPIPLYVGWRKGVSYTVTVISGTLALMTLATFFAGAWDPSAESRRAFFAVYAFWAIAPPLWFFVEYVFLFDQLRNDPARVQDFNTAQSLAQKFWASLLVLLGVFALVQWGAKF